ncbi:MAG TPA: amidohydrolase family protein, partial [Bacteroidota bacterium]
VIINPASVLSKDSELPPLGRFLEAGVPLALCSDWGIPDPFENMRSAGVLAKLCGAEPIDPVRLVGMHTIQAARALQLHHEVGSVEGGKKADLTFLDVSDIRLTLPQQRGAISTLLRRILQEAPSARVSDVMINGEFFIRKGHVMTYAEEDLKREYRDAVELIMRKTGVATEAPVVREIESVETPIIPLSGSRPAESEGSPADVVEPFEEGFRIIGKTGSLPQHTSDADRLPHEERSGSDELPKTVRKTFGDDDF